ncbi:MAG TPA: hypothetical protein VGY98_02510 [Verrucomicrobiae bacterium]|nr:hypothetical protein [Verrucomicrobiae bacterium]
MNESVDENSRQLSKSEAELVLGVLIQRGVVGINFDAGECRRKICELGLTLPKEGQTCLMYGRDGGRSLYLFLCFPDRDRERSVGGPGMGIWGFRFEIARYRSNPVAGMGVDQAFFMLTMAVAVLGGFDLATCRLEAERPARN